MTGTDVINLSPAETAKELRQALKLAFPGTKFSVRTRCYAGGSSIDVRYFRGPAYDKVDRLADRFEGVDFDAMQDLKTYRGPVLLVAPDGSMRQVRYSGSWASVRRDYDVDRYKSSEAGAAVDAAITARFHEGHAPNPIPNHRCMSATDWPEGQTLEEFAQRCADAYFGG